MKKTSCLLFLILAILFTACKKDPVTNVSPVTKTYLVKDITGAVAGNFTIGSNKEGLSVITIELEEKSHRYGTVYTATLCTPGADTCYAKLADVNAVIGYSETVGVMEQSSARRLTADELFKKVGYQLKIQSSGGTVAAGIIK